MKLKIILSSLFYFFYISANYAGDIVSQAPADPDTAAKYVFYMHGSAEEEEGDNEKYQAAVEAMAEADATVITEIREETDPNSYAEKIKKQVTTLMSKGVPAKNITVSGFSKGAVISLAAASAINNPNVNYILIAGCSDDLNEKYEVDSTKVIGRVFAIYDSSDDKFGSCEDALTPSAKLKLNEEEIDSGKGHKLFRIPKEKFISQWRDPIMDWLNN